MSKNLGKEGSRNFMLESFLSQPDTNGRIHAYIYYLKALDSTQEFDYPMAVFSVVQDIFSHPLQLVDGFWEKNSISGFTTVVSTLAANVERVTISIFDHTCDPFIFGYSYNLETHEFEEFSSDTIPEI